MKQHLFLFIIILFFSSRISYCQQTEHSGKKEENDSTLLKESGKKERKNQAHSDINKLKTGVLIVRLKNKAGSVEKLKESQNFKAASIIEAEQQALNLRIINAFRKNFDFCPVYFIYSSESDHIIQQHYSAVHFLSDKLDADPAILWPDKEFLTAELGVTDSPKEEYQANMSIPALIIQNEQFIQLQAPFPYYSRTFGLKPSQKELDKAVRKMNSRLHNFKNTLNE